MSHILIVEDESIIRSALRRFLERQEFTVSDAGSVDEATSRFDLAQFNLIISDLRLPGAPGTDLINLAGNVPVLIMTSYASLRSAVDAMKLGAADYIAKPFDHDEMLNTVRQLIKKPQLDATKPPESLPASEPSSFDLAPMIGRCDAMQNLFQRLRKVAATDATVLIRGESGTGKELAARAIHEHSQRSQQPLINVNCAAIPDTLIESELFGHEKGAFTGAASSRQGLLEAADGGTLFLDEIGELPLEAQARLLRFLQEGEVRRVGSVQPKKVDVRLIAATHRNLKNMAKEGLFREDLYYRLYVMELQMPPLRARGNDVLELADTLLKDHAQQHCKQGLHFTSGCRHQMLGYQWPGNVREMKNAIERAVILADGDQITWELMGLDSDHEHQAAANYSPEPSSPEAAPLAQSTSNAQERVATPPSRSEMESQFYDYVLANEDQMSETKLARNLGISRKCLWERRQKLGIPRKTKRKSA